MTLEQLAVDLLGLSTRDRALLASKLLASLDDVSVEDVEGLWAQEAQERLAQVQDASVELSDARQVIAETRSKLRR